MSSHSESGTARPGRHRARRSALAAGAVAVATAAVGAVVALASQSAADAAVLPNGFKSVGYMPSWAGSATAIQYSKLTHINYAFILPNSNGSLQGLDNPAKLQQIVSLGHAAGVKVSIAVGGWNDGNDSGFEGMAGNATARTAFVNNIVNLVNQYNLDGVDIDWEYPDPGTSGNNYTALMSQLSTAMHSRGKLLTAAVVSEGGTANGVQPAVFGYVDWLNIMAYDGGSPHANYDWSINSVNFWKGRGLPASKAVLGVPFYSRPNYYTFADLVSRDPANANRDCTTVNGSNECYNGLPTIRRKTQWAMANAGGIMNWELSQDATGANSLVSAIYETATGGTTQPPTTTPPTGRTGRITGLAGKCVDVAAASTANGTAIQLYTCNGTNAQTWTVATDGTLRALGKCMDVTSAGTANGTKIQLWDCNGTGAQVWQSQANGTLRNPVSNRCLDVTDNSSADGARLQIWDCFAGANQRWTLP
ncbi:glycosyl hydrolase family 18 protein [Dactylosporangium sp. AC04546]|uniref:glycosyl hydrolase family 18 protein n=1 Tax=Dactylosporangium sp. AC04546 TaxID=2862460 RepID=UPI001EDD13AB|nr:glycosyl hydrolase family 18 protein [Dactylosporangium sp. AC04546]WVK78265.1 glycosyl hydrolase family 18 protein [Dactylosporangium sp. AC04546]